MSWKRPSGPTTLVAGSVPIRQVPMTCLEAGARPSGCSMAGSTSPIGGEVLEKDQSAPASSMTASRIGPQWAEATSSWRWGA